ncbi:uncharacterized protein MELLADRAFT_93032 [Melampsora larici-populina 98AG31]|uniref:T6SS Phospholipase effector Tle1-like catalytic domain-containing protein n=1 Tax=Melampsora larici-populina (strain 98AG31 / pathotype 3-4-7) TaxID=747676 RepID=F4S3N7_MELLP|nr:uncharacterized protein MELLADRAFT_93032 [Melampsora larici-populina 98AG31]EGG00763.1 hypothetical protein MELLADRAFT_93032 [Melampsora larici-populina 98AG31]
MSTDDILDVGQCSTPDVVRRVQDELLNKPRILRSNSDQPSSVHEGRSESVERERKDEFLMISDLARRAATEDSRLLQTAFVRAVETFRATMAADGEREVKRASSAPTNPYSLGYVDAKKLSEEVTENSKRLHKRIIVCCDGTWQNGLNANDPRQATNVLRLARSIFPEDRRTFPPIPQVVHYQTGLGRLGTTGDPALNVAEGATGLGISAKIREAYAFIAQNYIPGDELLLFGFSRGAFTARTIVSLISDIGILTNQGMEDFYKIFAAYQARANPECQKGIGELERFLDDYREGGAKSARKMPPGTLKCVGVWDTVGALGIPKLFKKTESPKLLGFQDTNLSPHVQYAFHAIALNETREDFVPTKWIQTDDGRTYLGKHNKKKQILKQVWFAGAHSDVGGGNPVRDLADVSLVWMVVRIFMVYDIESLNLRAATWLYRVAYNLWFLLQANLLHHELLAIDSDYLATLLHPQFDWGEQSPIDRDTVREPPKTWNPATQETIHASVENQHEIPPDLQDIFENVHRRSTLVETLLPFEIEMKERWNSLTTRLERRIDKGKEVGINVIGEVRRTVLDILGEFFHFNRDRLWVNSYLKDSEDLAQHALESSDPNNPIR